MKHHLLIIFLLTSVAVPAAAEIPFLNGTCPTGIDVHADQGGPVYINGAEAEVPEYDKCTW